MTEKQREAIKKRIVGFEDCERMYVIKQCIRYMKDAEVTIKVLPKGYGKMDESNRKSLPCASENHEIYIAGKGYIKIKDLKEEDVSLFF